MTALGQKQTSGQDQIGSAFVISRDFASSLDDAKERATQTYQPTLIRYGGQRMMVAPDGMLGGYRYRVDSGPLGAIWAFKCPNRADPWGMRVSVKSLTLAVLGLTQVRLDLDVFLACIGADIGPGDESISRVDCAIDVLSLDIAAA